MPAANTDLLKKYLSLFSTTLSTSIGTGTSDTITPASVSGLPTDTAITITIDRVDSGGVATPTKMERIRGIISGGNLIDYVRGVDGTTEQAHTAGAVIEMVWNADDWNDMVDWALVSHNQSGYLLGSTVVASNIAASAVSSGNINASAIIPGHFSAGVYASAAEVAAGTEDAKIVTPKGLADSKAVGSDITTGTDDVKHVTSKAMADAGVNTRLQSKVITLTRDGTATSGNVSYTGVGFVPTSLVAHMVVDGALYWSFGTADSSKASQVNYQSAANVVYTDPSSFIIYSNQSGWAQKATVASYDADGFTLTWTKVSSPSTGTLKVFVTCYR